MVYEGTAIVVNILINSAGVVGRHITQCTTRDSVGNHFGPLELQLVAFSTK